MTGFSTPFPGSLSAGLNLLSAPPVSSMLGGSNAPASLLAFLRSRTSAADSLPGSPAPQLAMLPHAPHTGVGPGPGLPTPAQPPQNNLLSLAGGLGAFGNLADGGAGPRLASANAPWSWQASTGLFGGNGPLFGPGSLFGAGGLLGSTPPAWGTTDPWSTLSASQLAALGAGTGTGAAAAGAASAAALTSPEDFIAGLSFFA